MIERTIKVAVDLTPQELAFSFCNMGDGNQADFFNEVADITEKWERPFCFQLQYIVDHERLTNQGRRVMESIGEYGQDRIKEAAPALLEALLKARNALCGESLTNPDAGEFLYKYDDKLICEIDAAIAAAKGTV